MRIKLLGVNIDTVGRWEAMRILSRRLATGRQTAVYTPNPIMVRGAQKNELFRALLNRGDLMVADGIGILLGARLAGLPTPPRVAGIDLGEDVLAYAERGGLKVFLFGGKPGVAERAAEQLKLRFPTLEICGTHHGYISPKENGALLKQIRESRADVVMVCLGSPRQEQWIDENRRALRGVSILMGLGGSLDVWSGDLARAPRFFSKIGLEWLWRMLRQPRRLKGIPAILAFLFFALLSRWR